MDSKTRVLDLIPDSLKPQLFIEVAEFLEEKKREQEKKEKELTAEEKKMINDIVSNYW